MFILPFLPRKHTGIMSIKIALLSKQIWYLSCAALHTNAFSANTVISGYSVVFIKILHGHIFKKCKQKHLDLSQDNYVEFFK